jgi:hypothetical protein
MLRSSYSAWNKRHQPSTEFDVHITGQTEAGTTSTAIGELPNNSIDCFCHQWFNKLIKTKKQSPFFVLKIILP